MATMYDEVYGVKYKNAYQEMEVLNGLILQKVNKGFDTIEELEEWAKEHQLSKVVYSPSSHKFLCVSHRGEILEPTQYEQYYKDLLYYIQSNGKTMKMQTWHPSGFSFFNNAYVIGESSDGVHRPLFYRDYVVPTGYYSVERDAFNVAKPFPVFAKNTGADTSHIYEYINHIGGECAMWLLAWLRAKLINPTQKTQVVPILISKTQGSGKSTFAEVICKGLFGTSNVIVSDQYDATARFNADYADALIVCQEEKEETDTKNTAGTLKSRATATTIRKEQKGLDPIYQDSFTDFILTTNKEVPVKFDGREDQRRFMVMEVDGNFTRKTSKLADEVFTKLYGRDAQGQEKGIPFVKDENLIAQFKHELFTREDIKDVKLREFPKTNAYKRCFNLPRTNESIEIESIMRSIAPFIRSTLLNGRMVRDVKLAKKTIHLRDVVELEGTVQYMPAYKGRVAYVALCRPLVFCELNSKKSFSHSTVERCLLDCKSWLAEEYDLCLIDDFEPLIGGFAELEGRYAQAPCARFCLKEDMEDTKVSTMQSYIADKPKEPVYKDRMGKRLRVNNRFIPAVNGCFETVNEMKDGITSLNGNKSQNVAYMDTFLLESDEATPIQEEMEKGRALNLVNEYGEGAEVEATELYKERLDTSLKVGMELFKSGKICRIVYSGAKSYHFLVRVKDAPQSIDEYKWLHSYLCQNLTHKIKFDECTSDPARLTRSPIQLPRVSTNYGLVIKGEQNLVCENWGNVLNIEWREMYKQWLEQPKENKKILFPTREEYIVASQSLVDGSFWVNDKYDGNRQRLFFASYRLLRFMGYTHKAIWEDMILPKVKNYKKQREIGYWETRRTCKLIKTIDEEVDMYRGDIE